MPSVHINYAAVLVAAIAQMVIGAIWYSPGLFAKQWSKLVGRKLEDMRKDAAMSYGLAALAALITAFVLAHIVGYAMADTVVKGLQTGFWVWLGFVATTSAVNTVFAGRPSKLWAIDSGYFLVSLLVGGGILAAWH
jgi:hypothetical protein